MCALIILDIHTVEGVGADDTIFLLCDGVYEGSSNEEAVSILGLIVICVIGFDIITTILGSSWKKSLMILLLHLACCLTNN